MLEHLDETNEHLKVLAHRPLRFALTHKGYFVNGYKFHTGSYGGGHVTANNGVCVKGSCYNEAEADYYGLLDEVLEVEYVGVGRCVVVLFKCTWFDVNQGVRVDKKHDLVSVKYKSRLNTDDPFILASQAQQVYYTSYPSQTKELKDWWAVVKTKPRGIYEVAECANEVDDDDNVDGEHFFQLDERVHSTLSTSTNDDLESVPLVTPGAFVEVGSADGVDDDEEEDCQDTETDSDAPNENDVYLSNESSDE